MVCVIPPFAGINCRYTNSVKREPLWKDRRLKENPKPDTRQLISADLRLARRDRGTVRVSVECSLCPTAETLSRSYVGADFDRATMALIRMLNKKGWRINLRSKSPLCGTCSSRAEPPKETLPASAPSSRPAAWRQSMDDRLCIHCGMTYEATRPGSSTVFCNTCTSELDEHQKSSMTILWAGARIRAGRDARIELGHAVQDPWPDGFPVKGQ